MGSSAHFAGELFNMMAGVRMLHVPYKQFAAFIRSELAQNAKLAKFAGVKAE